MIGRSNTRCWLGSLAAVLATTHMAACTGADTVTLGAAVQLTGRLADTGRSYRDAYQFAVDRINEKGGIIRGDAQYRLALKILDSQSDSNLAARQHEELAVKDKVNVLLGSYSSFDVLAGAAVAEKHRVPMVQSGGAASRIFARGNKYVFGTLPSSDDYFRSTIAMLAKLEPKAKTVAIVFGDDPFDITLAQATDALLKQAGLEVVLNQQYSERTPNFYNILTLIESKDPDVILWSGHEASAVSFIRQAKGRNINPNLLASFTVGVPSASFRAALGKDANYAFGMTPWLPSERLKDRWFGDASQFAADYEKKFGYAPDYHAAAAVAAVETVVRAMEAASPFEPNEVRDAIAKVDFDSVYGRIRFGENGQIALPQTVIQIQDDKVVEIFTDRLINRPVYPVPAWDKRS